MSGEAGEQASVSASHPGMRPVSDAERNALDAFRRVRFWDTALLHSLLDWDGPVPTDVAYVIIRALRAGVRLEDLL